MRSLGQLRLGELVSTRSAMSDTNASMTASAPATFAATPDAAGVQDGQSTRTASRSAMRRSDDDRLTLACGEARIRERPARREPRAARCSGGASQ